MGFRKLCGTACEYLAAVCISASIGVGVTAWVMYDPDPDLVVKDLKFVVEKDSDPVIVTGDSYPLLVHAVWAKSCPTTADVFIINVTDPAKPEVAIYRRPIMPYNSGERTWTANVGMPLSLPNGNYLYRMRWVAHCGEGRHIPVALPDLPFEVRR